MDLQSLLRGTASTSVAVWRKRGDAIEVDREDLGLTPVTPRGKFVTINKEPEHGKK